MASSLGSITFGGLASGLPADMVDQLMSAQQTRLNSMTRDQEYFTNQKTAFGQLESLMVAMQSKAEDLDELTAFQPHSATSSDEDTMAVTASSEAVAAFHSVKIERLATYSSVIMGDGGTDGSDPGLGVSSGAALTADSDMTFTYNGTDYTANLSSGDTLDGIASKINALDFGDEEGVSASVLYDGTNYRLVMTAKDSGAYARDADGETTANGGERVRTDNLVLTSDLTFDDGVTISTSDFFHTAVGEDAKLEVDGLSNIYSSTNAVSDVIPGVTLNLNNTTSGTSTIGVTVTDDTDTLKSTVEDFLSSYNSMIDYISTNKSGVFMGESSIRSVATLFRREFNTATTVSGSFSTLAELGVETNQQTGKLSLDSTTFDSVVASDFNAVAEIFANEDTGGTDGLSFRIQDLIDDYTSSNGGILTGKDDGLDYRLDNISDRIEREQARLEKVRIRMTMKYANLEQLISSMNGQTQALTSALSGLS